MVKKTRSSLSGAVIGAIIGAIIAFIPAITSDYCRPALNNNCWWVGTYDKIFVDIFGLTGVGYGFGLMMIIPLGALIGHLLTRGKK